MTERQIPDRDPGFAPHAPPDDEPVITSPENEPDAEPAREVEQKFDEALVRLPPG